MVAIEKATPGDKTQLILGVCCGAAKSLQWLEFVGIFCFLLPQRTFKEFSR
jgi:hypothetical protein